jgi:chemotaxis protein CheD
VAPPSSIHRLKPCELVVCRDARTIETVLGSCVAVTMFNARLRIGGMCHAMLARPAETCAAEEMAKSPFKYVCYALPAMVEAFRRAGVTAFEIEVKLFGGGNVLPVADDGRAAVAIGPANIRMARLLLERSRLRVLAANVGGTQGRKIRFDTYTGEVLHKHLT